MKKIILITMLIFLPFYIFSNDGYYSYGSTGMLIPEVNKNISMEKEIIEIDVFPIATYETMATYKCTFWFKNNTNKTQSILMGFPILRGTHVTSDPGPNERSNTIDNYDFTVQVEGKKVDWKIYNESEKSEVPGLPFLDSKVYAFKVDFKPNETLKIVNTYKEYRDMGGLGGGQAFTYILQSGNTWEKPIGCTDVIIKYHGPTGNIHEKGIVTREVVSNPYLTKIEYSQKDPYTVITYHAENFKPIRNIVFPSTFRFIPFNETKKIFKDTIKAFNPNGVSKYLRGPEYFDTETINEYISILSDEAKKVIKNSLLFAYGYGGTTEEEKQFFHKNFKRFYPSEFFSEFIPIFSEDFDINLEIPILKKLYENIDSPEQYVADHTDDCIWMTNKIKNEDSWYYAAVVYDIVISNKERFNVSDKSVVRKLLYECGNFYLDKGFYEKAINLYDEAIRYAASYKAGIFKEDFATWEDEGIENAPCYYITYNRLCSRILKSLQKTDKYGYLSKKYLISSLEEVLYMGYPHVEWLKKDPDIAYIRENYPKEFSQLLFCYFGIDENSENKIENSSSFAENLSGITIKTSEIENFDYSVLNDGETINLEGKIDSVVIKTLLEKCENANIKFGLNLSKTEDLLSIEKKLFCKNKNLISIVLPDTVKTIEEEAFDDCKNLEKVDLGNGVISIKKNAFWDCTSLKNINFSKSLRYIGENAFWCCTGLKELILPQNLFKIAKYAFYETGLKKIIIPDSVFEIDVYAFGSCTDLESITLSNNLTKIDNFTFTACTNLKTITIPNSVTKIGKASFCGCTSLNTIIIPDSVNDIDIKAFLDCTMLENIVLSNNLEYIAEKTFENCSSLKTIIIPDSVTEIKKEAFIGCTGLETIILPNTLKIIGAIVFENCTSLKSINIPESVYYIDYGAFKNCTSLESVTLSKNMGTISRSTFKNCTMLENIDLPNNIKDIGEGAFENCSSLKTITIPDSVKNIYINAFKNCTMLGNIVLPNSLKYIGEGAFENCSSLNTITIPDSIIRIENNVFKNCTMLENIVLSNSLKYIREGAFENCTKLKSVTFPDCIKEIGERAFFNCTKLKTVTLPKNVSLGESAFHKIKIIYKNEQ